MHGGEMLFLFSSKVVRGWMHWTLDDISRRHKLSYGIKIVEIRRLVEAGELSEGFSSWRMYGGECYFDFVRKWGVVGGRRPLMTYLDVISFHRKLNCRNPFVG
ncbi:hypothetical protein AVEN_156484-1 [Araneus ventricosus]|uniref:Uncharacterized protein n=1 Tax=Araneus ventricosus TaxID=182803 RepID=A0A4Y2SLZ5_ARAVE|nr:hypothetical protein AVEN_156484-1 [Araneus ventricosus]